jgi:hypothetical protein
MRIPTLGQLTVDSIQFTALFNQKAEDMVINEFKDKATSKVSIKKAPNGKPLHRTTLKALKVDEDGNPVGEEQNVTVNLIEPADVVAGVIYGLWDEAWFTPWTPDGGRSSLSISGTTIKPVEEIRKLLAEAKKNDAPMKLNLPHNNNN